MYQPKSFRIILLSFFCLFIGLVFAGQLPIVKSENTIFKQKSNISFKQQPLNEFLTNLAVEEKATKQSCCGQTENAVETFTLIGSFYSLKHG